MAKAQDRASSGARREVRLGIARAQVPEILAWAGVLTLAFGIVNAVTLGYEARSAWIVNLIFGPLFLLLAWLIRSGRVPIAAVPWVWAASSAALVGLLANTYRASPTEAGLAYIALVMTAFAVLTSAWPPFLAAGAVMLAFTVPALASAPGRALANDVLVCLAALLVGAVLLRLRIRALDTLADYQARLDRQATYDPLSGVLNRNGMLRAIPGIVAAAQRAAESVLVWFVDVRGLKEANDVLGHDVGDAIIAAVGRALLASVRSNDVVGRWGGDEFIVVGTGHGESAEPLNDRVNELLAADPELVGRWAGTVTVGFASGPAEGGTDRLITAADAHMYQRRQGESDVC